MTHTSTLRSASAPLPDRVVRDPALLAFAQEVGGADRGPVAVEGGRTQWHVGGPPESSTRLVTAPRGVVCFEPAEMTVQVRAGSTVAELDAVLAEAGQCVALAGFAPTATVGGVLSVGRSGPSRLGHGPIRDALLQARYVSAEGLLVTAGGPTVKNVTGFDLCRLLVGSLGTVGLLAEVTLRTRPRPATSQWFSGAADPFELRRLLYRPVSLLWNGTSVWLLLEGYAEDVTAQAQIAIDAGLSPAAGPPELPHSRHSVDPGLLPLVAAEPSQGGSFVAEIGVGIVHGELPTALHRTPTRSGRAASASAGAPNAAVRLLNERLKRLFDPTGRLNPGRFPVGDATPERES